MVEEEDMVVVGGVGVDGRGGGGVYVWGWGGAIVLPVTAAAFPQTTS